MIRIVDIKSLSTKTYMVEVYLRGNESKSVLTVKIKNRINCPRISKFFHWSRRWVSSKIQFLLESEMLIFVGINDFHHICLGGLMVYVYQTQHAVGFGDENTWSMVTKCF